MKNEDVVPMVVLLVMFIVMSGVVSYVRGHEKGFYHGADLTKQYYEATGEFPSKIWLEASDGEHYNRPRDILDSIIPYTGGR